VPFSNNTPLTEQGRERSGLLFRAAGHEAPADEMLATLENILGLGGAEVLRYADRKKGQRRTMRLVRKAEDVELAGFVLAGDTSAQAWIKTLLQDELPAQAYGRLLLLPGATPPVAVQSRGQLVCTCLNVSDMAIDGHLALLAAGGGGAGHLHTDEERLASLQATLQCGTNCGSCVPELKRRVRSARTEPQAPLQRSVITIRQLA
jgi:assimilatory nitrate reductase catalytic subunit